MPPFIRRPSDRQPGIGQANDRQRSFGFNPRQKQRPGGFQPRMTPGPAGGGIRPPMGLGRKDPFDPDRLGIPEGLGRKDPFDPDRLGIPEGFGPKDPFDQRRLGIPEGFGPKDPFDQRRLGIGSLQEQAAVDRDDWRTWEKILGAELDPDDYEVTGIMGAMPEERQMAEVGLPQPMDWQNERLSLDQLINLGASEDQIAQYLGVA
jgi:hypothetical protein